MEEKSLISRSSTDLGASRFNFLKGIFNESSGMVAANVKKDALEAVKLDPAVLEAQVTMHANGKAVNTANSHRNLDVISENVAEKSPDRQSPSAVTRPTTLQGPKGFADMVMQQAASLLSLTPRQLEVLMKYVDVLRRQRIITQKYLECAFCKNNGKPSCWYTSHALRDARGRVRCPILRGYHCRLCGATGDQAHTIKYCPELLMDTQSISGESSF